MDANSKIIYGFELGQVTLPWSDSDIEDWWQKLREFKPSVEVYNEEGEYLNGVTPEPGVIDNFYVELGKWKKLNPIPIQVYEAADYEYPHKMIGLKTPMISSTWGEPEKIDLSLFTQVSDHEKDDMIKFCKEHLSYLNEDEYIEETIDWDNPSWYLIAYRN